MLRVVIDTSSLVSYVLTRSELMRQIVGLWRGEEITVLSTPATRAELAAVIGRPAIQRLSARPMDELVVGLERYSEPVPGRVSAEGACRDPKDDKFLACAAEGRADYLISSDKDLLVLRHYGGAAIVNPGQFLLAAQLHEMTVTDMHARFAPDMLSQIFQSIPLDPATAARVQMAVAEM